jgi:hypothetical protein
LYTQTPLAVCVIVSPQWLQTTTRQRLPSLVVTVLTGIAFYTRQSVVIPTDFRAESTHNAPQTPGEYLAGAHSLKTQWRSIAL